jgi:hypothetical protein
MYLAMLIESYRSLRVWNPRGILSRHGFFAALYGIMSLLTACMAFYCVAKSIDAWVWEGNASNTIIYGLVVGSSTFVIGIHLAWRAFRLYESTEFGSTQPYEFGKFPVGKKSSWATAACLFALGAFLVWIYAVLPVWQDYFGPFYGVPYIPGSWAVAPNLTLRFSAEPNTVALEGTGAIPEYLALLKSGPAQWKATDERITITARNGKCAYQYAIGGGGAILMIWDPSSFYTEIQDQKPPYELKRKDP